jgi:hypothetical protein
MPLYRKRPVVITAMQFRPHDRDALAMITDWLTEIGAGWALSGATLLICTQHEFGDRFEVKFEASDGDWVIRAADGAIEKTDDETFTQTYDRMIAE